MITIVYVVWFEVTGGIRKSKLEKFLNIHCTSQQGIIAYLMHTSERPRLNPHVLF